PVAPASPYAIDATDTAAPPAPEIPGLEATLAARATASPYATAEPARIQMGAPSSASVRRGDLVLEARLARDNYLAGESGRVEITVRNDGKKPLMVDRPNLVLADEQGKPAPPSYLQYPPAYEPPP